MSSRGHYGKTWAGYDQQQPIVAWGRDAGITDAIARMASIPEVSAVLRIHADGERMWRQAPMISGQPAPQVGGEWFHSVADRMRAIDTISTDFTALSNDLTVWLEEHRAEGTEAVKSSAQWFAADVLPTLDEWRAFAERERGSWFARAATSWGTFEAWHERVRRLRELARAHGILLMSADPVPLPKTLWEHGDRGEGSEIAPWMGLLKITIFGAMTLTGLVALYAGARDLYRSR